MAQLCETCQKAYGDCSWTEVEPNTGRVKFVPVKGWDAVPTVKMSMGRRQESYEIRSCPEYVPDPPRRVKKEKRAYGIDRLAVLEMLSKDTPVSEIADTFECCDGTIYEIRRELRMEGLLI